MTTTIEKFKLDILYKKLLGVPTANQLDDPSTEGGSSKPGIFPNQIYAQTIPATIVNPSSSLTGWTEVTSYSFQTRANTTYLNSGSTYFPTGTKKYTYNANTYIVYYKNLVLTDTRSQNDKKSFYSLDSTNTNLLKYAIPKNFDISSQNSYNALAVYDCNGDQIASDSNIYPWIFDPDSGILSFYLNALSSEKSPPVMSFIRYEGTFGMPTGAAILTAASNTFTGSVTIPTINVTGLTSINSGSSLFKLGCENYFNSTAITSPTITNGIATGTADGASNTAFNLAFNSWFGSGFVDSCFKVCYIYFNHRTGQINASSFNATSDYRIKENVITLDETYTIDKLRPIKYFNKLTKKEDIGVIAHELQEQYPYLVNGEKDAENNQSVNYTGIIGLLINEIQNMKKQINELKSQVDSFKNKLS